MKRLIVFGSIVSVSLFLFSCGGSSSCTNAEKYIPENLTNTDNLQVVADASDISE